jgi:DNA processing protein
VLGNPSLWKNKQLLAIVGARNASANGCQFARKLAQDAGAKNMTVVSGLARGIDTAAHVGSITTGTVAVMASGIGQIYPPENKALHDEIAAKGCIISEQPFNALPHSRAFPGRNRIIAGMSHATVIVEAALKSGSLITAKYALDQNRDVFAVPGSPLDPRCKGTNHLLKQGAHLCEGIEDVLENLHTQLPLHLAEDASSAYAHNEQTMHDTGDLTQARKLVASKLSYSPVQVDELLAQCMVPPNILSFILLELELAGRLQRHPGHKVSLVAGSDMMEAG